MTSPSLKSIWLRAEIDREYQNEQSVKVSFQYSENAGSGEYSTLADPTIKVPIRTEKMRELLNRYMITTCTYIQDNNPENTSYFPKNLTIKIKYSLL